VALGDRRMVVCHMGQPNQRGPADLKKETALIQKSVPLNWQTQKKWRLGLAPGWQLLATPSDPDDCAKGGQSECIGTRLRDSGTGYAEQTGAPAYHAGINGEKNLTIARRRAGKVQQVVNIGQAGLRYGEGN